MTKTITMIKVRLGEMFIALLLGEFLHRLVLIFEELPHVKERWDKKAKLEYKIPEYMYISAKER